MPAAWVCRLLHPGTFASMEALQNMQALQKKIGWLGSRYR
jgi:hypothetical protein